MATLVEMVAIIRADIVAIQQSTPKDLDVAITKTAVDVETLSRLINTVVVAITSTGALGATDTGTQVTAS